MDAWGPYEDGATVGMRGAEGGTIVIDIEHPLGARLTLERDCLRAPCAIDADVYGWLVHTRFFTDEGTARHQFGQMQADLENILHLLPTAETDIEGYEAFETALADFADRFP